jgi:hypothetical protein
MAALLAFSMSFPWLKNLSTAALEGTADEELGEDLVAHESTVARESFFLGGPSSQALTSFLAFVLRTLREVSVVAGVKLSNRPGSFSASSMLHPYRFLDEFSASKPLAEKALDGF